VRQSHTIDRYDRALGDCRAADVGIVAREGQRAGAELVQRVGIEKVAADDPRVAGAVVIAHLKQGRPERDVAAKIPSAR